MAGIAFKLQKMLAGGSYTDIARAYSYSAMISSGPFLVVMGTLFGIKFFIQDYLSLEESNLFFSLIVYVFAFSMLGTAPFFYVVTRYLADKYFLKEVSAYSPSYIAVLHVLFAVQTVVSLPYLYFLQIPFTAKWVLYVLFLFMSGIWMAMVYLSAGKNYLAVVWAFLSGAIISAALSYIWGSSKGLIGYIQAFTVGEGVVFTILTMRIFKEFGYTSAYDFGFFEYFKKHPYLMGAGIFYYAGLWIDKFIFWFSPNGDVIIPHLRVFTLYDTPIFLSFLTVIPSMAFFMVQMETNFLKVYLSYYEHVRKRASLHTIEQKRQEMVDSLSGHFQKYAIFQGIISGMVVLFIYVIADFFNLNPLQMGIFRIGILAAFLQMGYLMVINIIFYFDFQKEACFTAAVFFVSNAVCTFMTLYFGFESYGFGYALAGFITLLVSFLILNKRVSELDYWTFMQQPISIPAFKLESEKSK
ncbi:exopolysaccharide Pel transporter PelG [bacterium]|nr:exopolysaccharide Pel transporter PelG [bacterium]